MRRSDNGKTAFVFAGGGSLGAIQVGMLHELMRNNIRADFVVGASVGALNAAYFAGAPNADGVKALEEIWLGLRRHDIFPVTLRSFLGFLRGADSLIEPTNLRRLIQRHIPFANLEDGLIPLHVVATNLGGETVCLSSGSTIDALLASAAIPAAFPSVRVGEHHLFDGAVACNTPVLTAASLGADRIIVLPTGFSCALVTPPKGAIARALHALTLLIAHQLVRDLKQLISEGQVEVFTVPSLCPLDVSPYDFSHTSLLIAQSVENTRKWLDEGGLCRVDIPASLFAHSH
jgi:NTE family protein